jgi:acyl carrier protein
MTTENGAAIFDKVADIIAATSDIPRDKIRPDSHAINDLGIDSLDFLDIAFAIDKAFGIRLPLEQWTQEVNDGKATTEQYFVLKNLCASIDGLVAAKGLVDLPHPALGQELRPSPTARRAQAGIGVRARSARKGAEVDKRLDPRRQARDQLHP